MQTNRPELALALCIGTVLLLGSCQDASQSPPSRPEPPVEADAPEGDRLAPLDLVYICGNKFLATNSTPLAVEVTYRVVGTEETGRLTLRVGSAEDGGFSETELQTKERGVVELYQDDQRVARRRNQGMTCGISPMSASVTSMGAPATAGEWSAPFPWPIVAVHQSLLSDGRVLSFGELGTPQIWDPATGKFTSIPSPILLFCSGHTFLPDGRLLVVGGHIGPDRGFPNITIFTPGTENWSQSTPMRRGRWYPTATTMGSGAVAILAGADESGVMVLEPEVWTSSGLRVLTGASRKLAYYPQAFLAPNGKLFYAGHAQVTRYLDITGTGSWTTVATRLYGVRDYGSAVMYDEGKIIYIGGGRTTNTAEIIDLNSAAPVWKWTGSMVFPRRHLNATVLPTGDVLVTGGTSGTTFSDQTKAVHAAELWNPTTGTWTTLASNVVNRTYHSTSILLPDGRVLHSGSGALKGAPDQLSAELFSPPYLFKGARPTITDAPSLVGYGTAFSLTTPNAADIAKVSLIRLGSTTHAFDMNQRYQRLSFIRGTGALTIAAPTNSNITPPGHYMLFILDGNGVPSVAKIVKVGSESGPPPPNTPPTADFTSSCTGLACTFTDGSKDDGSVVAWSWDFGDNSGSSPTRSPSHSYGVEGSYDVTLTATDNTGMTGTITHTVSVAPAPPPPPIALTVTGRTDTTKQYMTLKWTGASGTSVDVYRNGPLLTNTPNDGLYTNSRNFLGSATYTYKVCLVGTTTCSNPATVQFGQGSPPPNTPPAAAFTATCTGLACTFSDGSADSGGPLATWHWAFGDDLSSNEQSPSHTYGAPGTYTVTLTVTDNEGAPGSVSKQVTASEPGTGAPVAGFSSSCSGLTCTFTDASTDDGSLTWSWDFGDNQGTSQVPSPNYAYAAGGTYTVTLTVTDDGGATDQQSTPVAVTAPAIALSVTGRTDATKQYMTLKWTGASGATVDVYRNGPLLTNTPNDGLYTNSRNFLGTITYTYKVCQVGTSVCSNDASVAF